MRSSAGSAPGSGSFAAAWLCGANPATANQKPELSSRLPSLPPSPGIAVGCFRLRSVNIAEVGNTRVRWEGKEIRSRGAIFVGAADFQILAPRLLVSIEELWLLPFAPWNREKGSGTPVDADPYPPHPAVRLAPCKARSPAGVPLAALAKGTLVPKAQRQAMFPATWPERLVRKARPNRGAETSRRSTGVTRAGLSQSSESTSRAGRSAGRHHAQAARERAVSSRPRAPHSLRFREYPRPKASFTERDSHRLVAGTGTSCQQESDAAFRRLATRGGGL